MGRPVGGSRAYAAYVLGLLTLINFFNYADRNVVFAVFESIKHDLRLSDQQLGWIGSAYIIVLSLAALPLGVLGDLRTRRGVIAWGVGLWSLFTSLGGAVRGFWQLFFCRAMVGVGEAGYGSVSQALIAEYYKERQRAFALGIYSVGMALGGVPGVWLGGLLAEVYGWRLAFLWLGVPGFLLAVLASRLREPERRPPTPLATTLRRFTTTGLKRAVRYAYPLIGLTAVGAIASGVLALIRVIPNEMVVAVFGMFVGVGVAWTVARLVPLALRGTAGAQEVAATAFEEFLVGGRLADWLSPRWKGARVAVAGGGFILGAPIVVVLILSPGLQFFVPCVFGTYFFYTWYSGPLSAVIFDVVPAAVRSSVMGAFLLFSHLAGDAVAPPLIGFLSDRLQTTWHLPPDDALRRAMLLLPAVGLVGGVVILFALRTVGRDMSRNKRASA